MEAAQTALSSCAGTAPGGDAVRTGNRAPVPHTEDFPAIPLTHIGSTINRYNQIQEDL